MNDFVFCCDHGGGEVMRPEFDGIAKGTSDTTGTKAQPI